MLYTATIILLHLLLGIMNVHPQMSIRMLLLGVMIICDDM